MEHGGPMPLAWLTPGVMSCYSRHQQATEDAGNLNLFQDYHELILNRQHFRVYGYNCGVPVEL